jgi:hypothetical protein
MTKAFRSSNCPPASADMAPSRRSKIRNNRPAWASAVHHSPCNRRRTGRRRSASSPMPDDRISDRSALIPAAAIGLRDFERGCSVPQPGRIDAAFARRPVTCLTQAEKSGLVVLRNPLLRHRLVQQQHRTSHHQRTADEHHGRPAAARPSITALRAALRYQRHLVFIRGREHAGKTAARRHRCGFERDQSGVGVPAASRVHAFA